MTSSNAPDQNTPNPGSARALMLGCKCSQDANDYGEGKPINDGRNRAFVAALKCTIHNTWAREDG
jgi:hypothetical protein